MATLAGALNAVGITDSSSDARILGFLSEDKYAEGLAVAESAKSTVAAAYALYRLGREQEALGRLSKSANDSRTALHLTAQILYRLERTAEAAAIYDQLAAPGERIDNEDEDVLVNRLALAAQDATQAGVQPSVGDDDASVSHEALLNASLIASAAGRSDAALRLLDRAEAAVDALSLPQDDRAYELAPILAQRAHLQHDAASNAALRSGDAKAGSIDPVTAYLVRTNFAAIDTPDAYALAGVYAGGRQLKRSQRLFDSQHRLVEFNAVVAAFDAGADIRTRARNYARRHADKDPQRSAALLELAYARATKASLRSLLSSSSGSGGGSAEDESIALSLLGPLVGRLVSAARSGGVKRALGLLDDLPKQQRDLPGVVGLRCALLDLSSDAAHRGAAEEELHRAINAAEGSKGHKVELLAGVIRRTLAKRATSNAATSAGAKAAKNGEDGDDEKVRQLLEKLKGMAPEHPIARSAALLLGDDDGAGGDAEVRIVLPDLSNVDIAALERGLQPAESVPTSSKRPLNAAATIGSPEQAGIGDASASGATSKRRRVRKLPKGASRDVPPAKEDAERWLPLMDRSYYKPKKSKGNANAGAGHQGGFGPEVTTTPAQVAVANAAAAGGGGKANKKKKKGKK